MIGPRRRRGRLISALAAAALPTMACASAVYFPAGCWRSPTSGRSYHGPVEASVSAPLTVLPYFFRCGTRPFADAPGTR